MKKTRLGEKAEIYLRKNFEFFHDQHWVGQAYANPAGEYPAMLVHIFEKLASIDDSLKKLVDCSVPPDERDD